MRTKSARRLASLALTAALAAATALGLRGRYKPLVPDAPDFRRKGPAAAKVQIVEFSDFQCPSCRYAEKPLQELLKVYGDRVRFTFKHFPLRMHQWAMPAALAAECAGEQGKFWEYHHLLYDRQDDWAAPQAEDFLNLFAAHTKLDKAKWDACRKSPETAARVSRDMKDGDNAFVGGTPTFFINGKRYVGAKQLTDLGVLRIERELKR